MLRILRVRILESEADDSGRWEIDGSGCRDRGEERAKLQLRWWKQDAQQGLPGRGWLEIVQTGSGEVRMDIGRVRTVDVRGGR